MGVRGIREIQDIPRSDEGAIEMIGLLEAVNGNTRVLPGEILQGDAPKRLTPLDHHHLAMGCTHSGSRHYLGAGENGSGKNNRQEYGCDEARWMCQPVTYTSSAVGPIGDETGTGHFHIPPNRCSQTKDSLYRTSV